MCFVCPRNILFSPDDTQILVCQMEVEFLPVVRHSEILLHILVFHLARDEVERPSLYQPIDYGRIYDAKSRAHFLLIKPLQPL